MKIGLVGLGRMGAGIAERLRRDGHEVVGYDQNPAVSQVPSLETLAPSGGYAYMGPAGAGHYAKMIHNGIEYGLLQAYAEGFDLLQAGDYEYDLENVAGLWNNGSVVRSWLLELAQRAFARDPK